MYLLGGATYQLIKTAAGEILLKKVKPSPGQIDLFSGAAYSPRLRPKKAPEQLTLVEGGRTSDLISLSTLRPKAIPKLDAKGRKRAPKGGGYFTNPSTGETRFFAGGKFVPDEFAEEATPEDSPQMGLFYDRLPDANSEPSRVETVQETANEAENPLADGFGDGGYVAAGDGLGAANSGSDRRQSEAVEPKLVTARAEFTSSGDRSLVPASVREFLADHQQEGVAKAIAALNSEGGFLLADGTGAGKTRQQLAIAQNYLEQGKKVLIVSPAEVLKPNWKKGQVTGSFSKDADAMGLTINLTKDSLSGDGINLSTYENLSKLKGAIDGDTVLIFDEAHYMKNSDSARTKHGIEMMKTAHAVLYATATPADKPEHIPYLFRAGIFKGHTKSYVYDWLGLVQKEVWTGVKNIKVWEMPRRGADQVYVKMAGLFDDLTDRGLAVKREISMDGVNVDFKTVTLPDVACKMLDDISDRYDAGENGGLEKAQMLMQQRRQLEPYKIPAAVDEAREGLKNGEQVILFVARVSESEVSGKEGEDAVVSSEGTAGMLRSALEAAGITDVVELHGGAKTKAGEAMDAFQGGQAKVIIATVESGGTGVNLDDTIGDAPRRLVMVTPPFNAVNNLQAAGRVWRMTTKSAPTIKYLFTDTEVDAWNRKIIANKMAAVGAAVQGEVGLLDLPSDVSDEAIEAFIAARDDGKPVQAGDNPRLPEAAKRVPDGFIPNKYGGYSPDGKYVSEGEGYIRKENGRWITYTKEQALAGGKVEKVEAPKTDTPKVSRSGAADAIAKTINAMEHAVEAKTWSGGDRIRVYLNKPGSRSGFGFLEIGPDGKAVDKTTLRPGHPILESLADRLQKAARFVYLIGAHQYKFQDGYLRLIHHA
jgi:superfamily II DNA or RNA helicase